MTEREVRSCTHIGRPSCSASDAWKHVKNVQVDAEHGGHPTETELDSWPDVDVAVEERTECAVCAEYKKLRIESYTSVDAQPEALRGGFDVTSARRTSGGTFVC